MMKAVCYFMTRNIYTSVLPSLKSLLKNGNIDRVYLMIEDDWPGFDLPDKVYTLNVSSWKRTFHSDGPNYGCRWSYMVMMKVVLSKIFPQMHRILSLDVDTIVTGDISGLWDLNLDNYYFAGAREWYWSGRYSRDCINAGVLLWNLDKMRDGMADTVIEALNRKHYTFPEQDALSDICRGKFLIMDSAYNCTEWTDKPLTEPKIIHFAAYREKFWEQDLVKKYKEMTWEEVFKRE